MKKLTSIVLSIFLSTFLFVVSAMALPISKPSLHYDSNQWGGTGIFFDSSTNKLSFNGTRVDLAETDGTSTQHSDWVIDWNTTLVSTSVTPGVAVAAEFSGGSLSVTQGTTTIFSGDISSLVFKGFIDDQEAHGDALITNVGGEIVTNSSYNWPYTNSSALNAAMVVLDFNLDPIISSTLFSSNFNGEASGDISPVPEPATLMLLGFGLFGLAAVSRKKFFEK